MMKRLLLLPLIVMTLWVCGFAAFLIWQAQAVVQEPGAKTDAILVLTGGTNRTHTGLMLLAAGQAEHLMISGVEPGVTLENLIALYDFAGPIATILRNHCCITLGQQATSTVENAIEAAPWIIENNLTTIRLVTSVYHIPRAMLMLREHAFDTPVTWVLHPVRPDGTSLTSLRHWLVMGREYLKLTVALLIPPQLVK